MRARKNDECVCDGRHAFIAMLLAALVIKQFIKNIVVNDEFIYRTTICNI
jgi:hypothetical protein